MENTTLLNAIEKAIEALEIKYDNSEEDIVRIFLGQYKALHKLIIEKSDYLEALKKIQYCTKIYIQSSSNYAQDFLNKMDVVEEEIRKMLNS